MIRFFALLFVFMATHVSAAPTYGTYTCIAQRVVGIQGRGEDGQRYHGLIKLKPEQERFLATISPITDREWCNKMTSLDPEQKGDDLYWWSYCNAKNEVSFSQGKSISPMQSDNFNMFYNLLFGGMFHLLETGVYTSFYTDARRNYWLEEGVCHKR